MSDEIAGMQDDEAREFDLVVFGATGLTGRLVVEQLGALDPPLRRPNGAPGWAVAGRDRDRVARVLADLSLADVEIVVADLADRASLAGLAGVRRQH